MHVNDNFASQVIELYEWPSRFGAQFASMSGDKPLPLITWENVSTHFCTPSSLCSLSFSIRVANISLP